MDALQAFERAVVTHGPGCYRVSPHVGRTLLNALTAGHRFRAYEQASTVFIDKRLPELAIEPYAQDGEQWLCG